MSESGKRIEVFSVRMICLAQVSYQCFALVAFLGMIASSSLVWSEVPVPPASSNTATNTTVIAYAPPVVENHQGVTLIYPKPSKHQVAYVATSTDTTQKWKKKEKPAASSTQKNATQSVAASNYEYSLAPFIQYYNKKLTPQQARYLSLHVHQLSKRYGVPTKLMASIVAVESSYRHDAISSSGAIGLGQLKPDTARWLGVSNPYDPVQNLTGTARYLGYLLQKFNGQFDKAVASYYQGQGSVSRNGIHPNSRHYLAKVNKTLRQLGS